jgi:hypothetical protein
MDERDAERTFGSCYESFDEQQMTLTFRYWDDEGDEQVITFPARFEVCELCDGRGSHVAPGVDAGGITAEDMYDDPDFAEDYFGGAYDVPCYRCGGKRVEPVVVEERLSRDQMAILRKIMEDCYDERRERSAEMEWGY